MAPDSSPSPRPLAITWLGHSTFLLELPSGQRVITDPWLGNPLCPPRYATPDALVPVDLVLVSHGHDDHSADALAIARVSRAPVVCLFELGEHFAGKGLKGVRHMGIGGTQQIGDLRVTMTAAVHTGSIAEQGRLVYLGGAAGFVLRAPDLPTLYFAGDTALFGDMKTIGEIYRPAIAFLPIGDHYTMGPDTAAIAARWLGVRQVVPMHWGTFPLLTGTPAALRAHLAGTGIDVLELAPGETAT
ncbi:MAG: metal-dependent hydrolase [Acidobacteria bacterium]|nr:metal-dependent hydrolase [Acidobacteriota bacterium]